jgi:hypothetical protein
MHFTLKYQTLLCLVSTLFSWKLLVEIGPEGWTPTQQPPEFSPSLRLLPQGLYFYSCEERECYTQQNIKGNKEILNRPKTA